MFARTAFRTFQAASAPLKQASTRRYATAPAGGSGGGSNTTALIAGAALAAGAGGYYVFSSSGSAGAAQKAEAAVVADAKAATAAKEAFTGGDQGFVPLTVERVETLNHNTKRVRFRLPEADQVSGMHAASALLTKFKPDAEGAKPVIRPYTAVSDDDALGHLDLLVKRYEGGAMSSHIHALQPGDTLDVKGPIVKYRWAPNKHAHIALVAGGTGITPMYQLLRAVFQSPGAAEDRTKVTLVFGNVAEEDILLHDELRKLENTFPQRFRAFYVLEKPPAKNFQGATGYITKDLLKQVLPEPKEGDAVKVFVCGPPGLMKAVSGPKKSPSDQGELSGVLQELGYSKDQVVKF